MSTGIEARDVSLQVLEEVEKKGAYVNLALSAELGKSSLSSKDRKLAAELAYGTVTYRNTLDWMIAQAAGRPVDKLDKTVLNILRLGFYQLFYLDRIPASAACNTAVELVKKRGRKGLSGFVNGVMRGALRKRDEFPWPNPKQERENYLSLVYSHPHWLVQRWLARYGLQETKELLKANNCFAPLSIRVNTLRTTKETLTEELTKQGIEVLPGNVVPESLILKNVSNLSKLRQHREGHFQVQGESSMLVSTILDPRPGEKVLDVCSAPGGKTTHLAQLMLNKGEIISMDIHSHRLRLLEKNCKRLGVDIVRTVCGDGRQAPKLIKEKFDRILLDVPCSGLGVVRRKPDLKWRRSLNDIESLQVIQKDLLSAVSQLLKPGGKLLYSACTNEPEETDEIISAFLQCQNQKIKAVPPASYLQGKWLDKSSALGAHFYPHYHKVDGFFVSLLECSV